MATPEDIAEAKRVASAKAYAQSVAKKNPLTDLQASVAESKKTSAAAANVIKAAEADKAAAVQAQISAARNAASVAAKTGGTINADTGLITPPSTSNKAATPKKIIGYIQWTNPFNGVSYNVPQYNDGSNDLVNWTGGIVVPQSFTIYTPPSSGGGGGNNTSQGSGNTTDPAVLALIKSLQDQIAGLSASNQQAAIDAKAAAEAAAKQKRENALVVLTDRFNRYGLSSLIPKIKTLIASGASEDTISLQLQDTEEYKQRFIANEERLKKGLKVLDPGTYIGLEDRYRQILRSYGLKQFDNDSYVSQFLGNDVSPEELSSRVVTAVQRVQNADPAVSAMLRQFYGIGTTDMVAYVLDPAQQFPKVERQVAAAEIGVAAARQGLTAGVNVAEQLAAQGITEAQAQKGYATIADILPGATKLSEIYTGVLDQYGQAEAEQEVFNSLASAQRKRRRLTEREIGTFRGSSGVGRGSLGTQTGGTF